MIKSLRDLVDAENDGKTHFASWRKTVSQNTTAGVWFDMSMSPGNPVPNYYAASPLVAVALAQSTDGGISHGQGVAQLGYKKYLKSLLVMATSVNAAPLPMLLCDYLLYYPFVDMGNTDPQPMTNTVALPRHSSGLGVQIMAVQVAAQSGAGNPQFFVTYTNSDGVAGRTTQIVACNTATATGSVITAAGATRFSSGPFLGLQAGDKGVRSVDSVQFLQPDIGLIALVLVAPVENISLRTIDAPAERVPVTDFMDLPQIQDDAYLNLLCLPQAGLSTVAFHGTIQTIWG